MIRLEVYISNGMEGGGGGLQIIGDKYHAGEVDLDCQIDID